MNPMIERIKKLLALANSDNENEAKLAMERASELLLRHNLSMADVSINRPDIGEETVKDDFSRIATEDKFIMSILENHFFIKSYFHRSRFLGQTQYQLKFVGEPMNIEIASYTYAYLFASYRALWLKYKRETGSSERSRQAYYAGLTVGIKSQLEAKKVAVQQETGLVVVPDHRIKRYMAAMSIKSTKSSSFAGDASASAAGMQAGRELQIKRGLKAQSATKSGLYLS